MGRHRAAGSLLSLLLGVFLLVQASLFANGAAETNGVLLDEYGVQYAVRATRRQEKRLTIRDSTSPRESSMQDYISSML